MRIGSTDACIRPLGKLMLAHADLQFLDSIVKNQGLPALVAETITSWRNFDRNDRLCAISVVYPLTAVSKATEPGCTESFQSTANF